MKVCENVKKLWNILLFTKHGEVGVEKVFSGLIQGEIEKLSKPNKERWGGRGFYKCKQNKER